MKRAYKILSILFAVFAAAVFFAFVITLLILGQGPSFLLFALVLLGPMLVVGIFGFAVLRIRRPRIAYRALVVTGFIVLCGSYVFCLFSVDSDVAGFAYGLIAYVLTFLLLQSLLLAKGAGRALVELFKR